MMRAVASAVLSLYPKAWRERYGEEVADLIASRPARVRTVLDLVSGAADAWLHHRRVPGARTLTVPLAAVLTCMGAALLLMWNPGLRDATDVASLRGVWAEAGPIARNVQGMAQSLFGMAGVISVLSVAPLLNTCLAAMRGSVHGPLTRMTARRVVMTAWLLVVPVGLVGLTFVSLAFLHAGYPVGPLGEAMAGGFYVPLIMALVLPLPMTAAGAPSLGSDVRGTGQILASAALCNALAWGAVATLLTLGLEKASWSFVAMVATGALVSVWMTIVVTRSAIRRGRTVMGQLSPA
ncbi:hypothetical protein AB0L65_03700 [Nonomuraea sp. NPDC052116]|uniref:hypothetical protein n=1 Tax=Nonomuraea sp. NPDC052116 TaxID=3155665 RepID=UPI00343DC71A